MLTFYLVAYATLQMYYNKNKSPSKKVEKEERFCVFFAFLA